MLFTQATESGIQLENAIILPIEQYKKALIPENNARINDWAKDNHVNINIGLQQGNSDFNCIIGVMMDERVGEDQMSTRKKMLKHLGEELVKFINDLPDEKEDAKKDVENIKKLDAMVGEFKAAVKEICGDDTVINIEIYKLRAIDADELMHMFSKDLKGVKES